MQTNPAGLGAPIENGFDRIVEPTAVAGSVVRLEASCAAQIGNSPDLGGPLPLQLDRTVQTNLARLSFPAEDDFDRSSGRPPLPVPKP